MERKITGWVAGYSLVVLEALPIPPGHVLLLFGTTLPTRLFRRRCAKAASVIRDGRLIADEHAERVDSAQMHEGRVREGRLIAVVHAELLDPAQIHACRVRDHLVTYSCSKCSAVHSHRLEYERNQNRRYRGATQH